MSKLETASPTTAQTTSSASDRITTTDGEGSATTAASRPELREMTYAEGVQALAPGGGGGISTSNGQGITAHGSDETALLATDEKTPEELEQEQVAALHGQTIDALVEELRDLRQGKQRVFKRRRKKRAAADAKAIFGMLAQYDSQTITAAWRVARGEAAAEFDLLVDAIGYKDAARAFPREARATLAACEPARLVSFAQGVVDGNPFAAQLAVDLLPEADRAAFGRAHPELATSDKLDEADRAKLDVEAMTAKDEGLRAQEQAYRQRAAEGRAQEADKAELASQSAATAAPLIARIEGLIAAGGFVEALGALAGEPDEGTFLAAVRGLEGGPLRALLAGLSFDEKWNRLPRQVKRVFAARTYDNNVEEARRLLDIERYKGRVTKRNGKTKEKKRKALTSVEAYAAYQLLKALPAAQRELFHKTYPDLVVAMQMHLNESMREGDDTNLYGAGGGDQETTAQLVAKVGDDALWTEAPPSQLDMTLRMVIRAGRRDAIASKLRELEASGLLAQVHGDAARRGAVEGALGLVGEPGLVAEGSSAEARWLSCLKLSHTIEATDEDLDHAAFGLGRDGVGNALVHANRKTRRDNRAEIRAWREAKRRGEAVGDRPERRRPTLIGQVFGAFGKGGIDVDNVALDELQGTVDAFGYGADIEFKSFGERTGDNRDEERNLADFEFDQNAGVFDLEVPHLELVRLRYPMGDMVVETGPVLIKGVKIRATWPTPHNPAQASMFTMSATSLDIQYVMVTQPGALIGIAHIEASDLSYASGEQAIDFSNNPGADAVVSLLAERNPARSLITFGLQAYQGKEVANDNIAALQQAFVGKPSGAMGGMTLELGEVTTSGITYNAGTFVEQAKVQGISLVWDSRPSVGGQARIDQLQGMLGDAQTRLASLPETATSEVSAKKRARLEADIARWTEERAGLEAKMPGWRRLEAVYQEIYEHQRLAGALPDQPQDAEALAKLRQAAAAAGLEGAAEMSAAELGQAAQARLAADSRLVASVAQASVEGVEYEGYGVADASVTGVNITAAGGMIADQVEGGPAGTGAQLDVAEAKAHGLTIAGSIPSVDALRELAHKRDELRAALGPIEAKPAPERTAEEVATLARDGKTLAALEVQWGAEVGEGYTYGRVVEEMLALDAAEGAKIQSDPALLRQWQELGALIQGAPTTVASVVATSLSGTAQMTTSEAGEGDQRRSQTTASGDLSLAAVELGAVTTGDTRVGSAAATDVRIAGSYGARADAEGETKQAADARLSVGTLRAKDVAAGGATLDEVGAEGVAVGVTVDSDQTRLDLGIGKVYAKGAGLDKGLEAAANRKASLQAQIAAATAAGDDPGVLQVQLDQLEASLQGYLDAYAVQGAVEDELKAVDAKLEAAGQRLVAAQREAGVFKHRVSRREEEAIAAADQRRVAAIEAEIEALEQERAQIALKLTEPQGVIASFESSLGIEGETSLSNVALTVEGDIGIDKLTAQGGPDLSGDIRVTLGAGPLKIPTLDYDAPSMHLVLGGAEMPRVTAEATVSLVKGVDAKGNATHSVGGVAIHSLSVPSVTGDNLRITLPVEGEAVEIELPRATMAGLSLSGVQLAGFDAASLETATGVLDIASVQTSLSATMGESLSAQGSLSLSGLHAEALSSGALNFGLADVTLDGLGLSKTETKETASGSSVVSQIIRMGGKASKLGKISVQGSYDRVGKTLSTTVGLGDLTLSGIRYAGGGTSLGVGYAALKDASITVKAKLKQGELRPGESSLESLVLDELKATTLVGSNIWYVGSGNRKERFQDGTEKVHPIAQEVRLKSGRLHGLSVRGVKLVGDGPTALGLRLGSGTVEGLAVALQEDGKDLLQANVSAAVSGVSVTLVDDELTANIQSLDGDVSASIGDGEAAVHVDVQGAHANGVDVAVHDLGKQTQSMDMTLATVNAKKVGFEQGLKGTRYNKPVVLGSATLNGVRFHDDHDKMSVDIASGVGVMSAAVSLTHSESGSTDYDKSQATDDQFFVPTQKVTWTSLKASDLDGFLKLNYPDKSQLLRLNFTNGGVALDLQENIDRMWSEWLAGFERDGESSFAYMWKKAENTLKLPNNLLWTALFKGLEVGFTHMGKKVLGDWPAIEATILQSLNSSEKTSIVEGYRPEDGPQTFTSFADSINEVIQKHVEPAIEAVCDAGIIYDAVQGDWGRAAKTTGAWLAEKTGDAIDWGGSWFGYDNTTNLDDAADKEMEVMREQRRAELEAMVKSGLDKVLGWGAEMDLHSKGGIYKAEKQPLPDPEGKGKRTMLQTGLSLDISGGGTLKELKLGTTVGLQNLQYNDQGSSASVSQVTMTTAASSGVNADWSDEGLQLDQASVDASAKLHVRFSGLRYEMDKSWLPTAPAGIETSHERYKRHGTTSNEGAPISDGDGVYYNAADYAHRVKSGQGVYGEQYSEELSLGEAAKKSIIQYGTDGATTLSGPALAANVGHTAVTGETIGTTLANAYETSTIKAKNAEVYGKYEEQWQQKQDKKKQAAGS